MNDTDKGTVLCLGELMLRLSGAKDGQLFDRATVAAHFGGAEANVAIALARIGRPSRLATVLPEGVVGDGAIAHLRGHGVDVSGVTRAAGRLGLYYLNPGAGIRPSAVLYDRAGSTFARAVGTDFDWPRLCKGAAWLHLSGITPALGPESAALGLEAIRAAKAHGLRISFDGNYRATLWERWNGSPRAILRDYVAQADLFIGNHRDIGLLLDSHFDGDGPERRRAAAEALFGAFPNVAHIASTARETIDADNYRLSTRVDARDGWFQTGVVQLNAVIDRIGTGDAFAAGVIAALDDGPEEAAEQGLALAALKHFTAGDASIASAADIATFRQGHFDVRR